MAVVLIAVIAFIYKPAKYTTGKSSSVEDDISEDTEESADEE